MPNQGYPKRGATLYGWSGTGVERYRPQDLAGAQVKPNAPASMDPDGWFLLLEDHFTSLNLRTRGRDNGYRQSWRYGQGLWTPRNAYSASDDLGSLINGNEYQYFTDPTSTGLGASYPAHGQLVQQGSMLRLKAEAKPASITATLPNGPGETQFAWVSGQILTEDAAVFGNEFWVEARVRVQRGDSHFPAFWLYPRERLGTYEFDVMEWQGHQPTRFSFGSHGPTDSLDWTDRGFGFLDKQWAVVGMRYASDAVTFYQNGKEVGSYAMSANYNKLAWFLWFNNSILNWDTYATPNTGATYPFTVPNYFDIDYVRVWGNSNTKYGGDFFDPLDGSTSWVRSAVGTIPCAIDADITNDRLYAEGGLRHMIHTLTVNPDSGGHCVHGDLFACFGRESGTMMVEYACNASAHASTAGYILSTDDSYQNLLYVKSGGTSLGAKHSGGELTIAATGGVGGRTNKTVLSWDTGSFKGCANGGTVASASGTYNGYYGNYMRAGRTTGGGTALDGSIARITFWPTGSVPADATLQALCT